MTDASAIRAVRSGKRWWACVLADHYLMHRGQTGVNAGEGTAWPFKA